MEPSKASGLTRTISKRRSSASEDRAPARRGSGGSRVRAAWITDPGALLAALERAERGAVEQRNPVVEMPHASEPSEPSELPALPALAAPPVPAPPPSKPATLAALHLSLREDERVARATEAGVVVIVRRRRAA